MTVAPIPPGYTSITPWMISRNTLALMDYLTQAFDARTSARWSTSTASSGTRRCGSGTRS